MSVFVKICVGSSCHLQGAEKIVQVFQELIKNQSLDVEVELKGSFCLGTCSNKGVAVSVNDEDSIIPASKAESFFLQNVVPLASK